MLPLIPPSVAITTMAAARSAPRGPSSARAVSAVTSVEAATASDPRTNRYAARPERQEVPPVAGEGDGHRAGHVASGEEDGGADDHSDVDHGGVEEPERAAQLGQASIPASSRWKWCTPASRAGEYRPRSYSRERTPFCTCSTIASSSSSTRSSAPPAPFPRRDRSETHAR